MVTAHYPVALCTRSSFLRCRECVEFVLVSTERQKAVGTKIVVLNVSTLIDRIHCVPGHVSYYIGAIDAETCGENGLWGQWSGCFSPFSTVLMAFLRRWVARGAVFLGGSQLYIVYMSVVYLLYSFVFTRPPTPTESPTMIYSYL